MKVEEMSKYPQMVRRDLKKYLRQKQQNQIYHESFRENRDYDLEDAAPEEHHPQEEQLQ